MLQTSAGETVTQNPAWRRQFKAFALDKVKQEVAVILEVSQPPQNGQERVWQFIKFPLNKTQFWEVRSDSVSVSQAVAKLGASASASLRASDSEKSVGSKVSGVREPETLCLVLAQDVTEQQQLASELAAKNADLIQLNRLKDEFLACISHELKTPLTTVIGLSTLLKEQALGQLNERQARYAGLIHQSGRHLMTVVNDIFDLTRMETGQLKLTLEPVQIETVCDRAIKQARAIQHNTAGEALPEHLCDDRFTLLIEPGLDSLVADELRLSQMLVHLLSNAFKFTERGGEIGLRVNSWEGWIAFNVWDTGIGIPEQKQHLIFQKFQQLENPLTRQFQGTGLGLVLTRALARLHGGDVTFLSKEGKGSEFTLLLPPSPPHKRAGGAGEENPSATPYSLLPTSQNHPNRLVLVVEAAPQFIENLTEQLTGLGYLVVIARSGTEALEKARRLQPGAVFLNPLLPLLSGWDVLTLLKSDAATRQIPVVVTATRAEKEQAFSNRADDFLSLPVQQQVLQQVLARFCAIPLVSQSGRGVSQSTRNYTPLTILRLVTPHSEARSDALAPLSLPNHRVLEADDLEQAELLAQFWQPHVVLLNEAIPDPLAYLKQLFQHPSLKDLPLVTLDAVTTEAANKVTGLSVFPCLPPDAVLETDALLSVLQTAAGMSWAPSLLVVDIATLPDFRIPTLAGSLPLRYLSSHFLRSEWFQALIQYLQTAGFRGMLARSWAEVLQQIIQQNVDLLLICLGESKLHPGVLAALTDLGHQHDVPPVLVLDQRLSQGEVRKEFCCKVTAESDAVDSLETVLRAIATQILPPSLSMEELLDQIHQTLAQTRGTLPDCRTSM
jgi:signal transduction histidine kinase/CheY-like chemotaxis protein